MIESYSFKFTYNSDGEVDIYRWVVTPELISYKTTHLFLMSIIGYTHSSKEIFSFEKTYKKIIIYTDSFSAVESF